MMDQAQTHEMEGERGLVFEDTVDRLLLWDRVHDQTGLSRTTAWRMERAGDFPERVQVSPGRVGWRESEVAAWNQSRRKARLPPVAGGKGRPRKRGPGDLEPASVRDEAAKGSVPQPVDVPGVSVTPVPGVVLHREPALPRSSAAVPNRHRRPRVAPGQLGFDF